MSGNATPPIRTRPHHNSADLVFAASSLKRSFAYQWRIPISVASIGATVTLVALYDPMPIFPLSAHAWTWSAGTLVLAAGVVLRLWAAACLGGRKSAEVVRVGPYSLCRNPLYVGTLLIATSQCLFYESGWILLGLALPVTLYALGVVPAEEAKLRRRLGEPYERYCAEVPRWWPRFAAYKPNTVESSMRSLCYRLEFQRSLFWLCLPLIACAISAVRDGIPERERAAGLPLSESVHRERARPATLPRPSEFNSLGRL